ncbi:nuclear DNA-binding protein [Aureococcus anophagefferens]|uniref:Nuclear DNA-binding protein n=1 Tax=Aureococcus anophagefferens TaxID=44056 RepID=A0ABR1FID5_AURAN
MSDPPALGAAAPTTSDVPEPEQSTMSAATHAEFLELMQRYGRSWTKISSVMKTRTEPQVRSHAQKHFLRINKEEGVDPAAKRPRTNAGGHLAPNELPRHLAAGSPDAAHVAAFGRSATPWTGPSPYASYGAPAYGGVYPQAGFVPPGPYGAHPGAYVGAPPSAPRPPYYGAPPPDAAAAAQAQAAQALYSLPQAPAPARRLRAPPAGYAPPPAGYAPPPPPPPPPQAPPGQAAPAGVALGLLQQLEQLPRTRSTPPSSRPP